MTKRALAALIILFAPLPAWGQQPNSYVYVFAGPVVVPKSAFTRWNGDFIHVGGGGEARVAGRFAMGGEAGALLPVTNQYAVTTGVLSLTPAFHFISTDSKSKFDPFAAGGVSLLVGHGGAFAIHYGGGMNYWFKRRVGMRVEVRDHLWTPESGEHIHLVDFRFGVVFGMH